MNEGSSEEGETKTRAPPDRSEPFEILLVEDNQGDVTLITEALKESPVESSLRVLSDGREALDYLQQRGDYEAASRPDLILLDLNLPVVSGIDVLEELDDEPPLDLIPVVVLTGSENSNEITTSYEFGASAYFVKPVDPDDYMALIRSIVELWGQYGRLPRV